jgi:hypothetical protein
LPGDFLRDPLLHPNYTPEGAYKHHDSGTDLKVRTGGDGVHGLLTILALGRRKILIGYRVAEITQKLFRTPNMAKVLLNQVSGLQDY